MQALAIAVGVIAAGVLLALWNRYSPVKTASPVGA